MPVNDPNNNKDPWGGGRKPEGPPDLDILLAKIRKQLWGKFGGNDKFKIGTPRRGGGFLVGLVIVVLFIIWFLSGIFIVAPAERSVILRFGQYQETVGPGPHWIPRLIDSKYTLNVQRIANYSYQAEMLTKDENIVSAAIAIQYRIDNPENYLFSVVNPVNSLQQATASALRQVIGHTTLNDILTTGRQQVRDQVADQLRSILQLYNAGVAVTDVTLQPAKPPEPVTAAFDDAIKAREDEQRFINKAQAYAQRVIPIAQGQASRVMQEAEAFRQQVVLQAKGATVGYLALLPEYKKAPQVMRERLYLEAMESVLGKTTKVLLDNKGGNVIYLPMDSAFHSRLSDMPAYANAAAAAGKAVDGEVSGGAEPPLLQRSERFFIDRPSYPAGR